LLLVEWRSEMVPFPSSEEEFHAQCSSMNKCW